MRGTLLNGRESGGLNTSCNTKADGDANSRKLQCLFIVSSEGRTLTE